MVWMHIICTDALLSQTQLDLPPWPCPGPVMWTALCSLQVLCGNPHSTGDRLWRPGLEEVTKVKGLMRVVPEPVGLVSL